MTVGNNIKFYREKNGLTQKELSQQIHVSRQTISNWENGISYPDIESTVIMSSIFNCSLDELLNRDYALVVKKLRIKKIVQKVNKYGTLLFLIANMITLFINFTIDRKLNWSLVPLTSSILVVTFIQTFCRV
ncbi:helix-turn-helix transcriptional regulator [uncultured Fructobacillus sp.]|uniref:helix-turn-helix transcriptional regulator n=1 Tax=uncultured Fructobacillus sp. TaxID=591942 RepID=UPI00259AD096|nr:helix-turn-helix transcriptional regulator [uncultured Fructobacillus sp.]